jgi:GPH family glycoside/pentoside/hexuronide:cation symporter
MAEEKLRLGTKLGFGVGDLGGNLFYTLISFYVLYFLTDVAGLAAAAAGTAIMAGKLWDAFSDPMVGLISDRTKSRWGRRRPYLLFGAVPLGFCLALFFWPVGLSDQNTLFWWSLLTFAVLNTAYSFVNIPYTSLSPELTPDYNERTSLNGYRFVFAAVGTLCGAAFVDPIRGLFPGDAKTGFFAVGVLYGCIIAVTAVITGSSVRERPSVDHKTSSSLLKSWLDVWKNRPFRIILGTYTLHLVGLAFLTGILKYFFQYVLHDGASTTTALFFLLAVAMLFIPISVLFSKRFGKVITYQLALVILAVCSLLISFFGAAGGNSFVFTVMAFAGIGLGFSYVPPFAMSPDAIEVEARKTGRREEGAYYGLWNFAIKFAAACGAAVLGWALGWSGYVANQEQNPAALWTMQLLIGPVPAFFFLAAAALLFRYPLDQAAYKKIVG